MKQSAPLEVGVVVHDLPAMTAFYRDALGCTVQRTVDVSRVMTEPTGMGVDGFTGSWLQTQGGEIIKLLQPNGSFEPFERPDHLTARAGVAYLTFYVDDIDDTLAAARAAGAVDLHPVSPHVPSDELSIAFFTDPEGNAIELVQRA